MLKRFPYPDKRVWKYAREQTNISAAVFFSGTPVAIFAGFSLAAAVQILTSSEQYELKPWAGVAFVVASGFFVLALLVSTSAQAYSTRPSDLLDLVPEARQSEGALEDLIVQQRSNFDLVDLLTRRTRTLGVAGILAAFVGVFLLLVGTLDGPARIVGESAVAITALGILVWLIRDHSYLNPKPGDVGKAQSEFTSVSEEGIAAVLDTAPPSDWNTSEYNTLDRVRALAREQGQSDLFDVLRSDLLPVVDNYVVRHGAVWLLELVDGDFEHLLSFCFTPFSPTGDVLVLASHRTLAFRRKIPVPQAANMITAMSRRPPETWHRRGYEDGLLIWVADSDRVRALATAITALPGS